VAENIRSIVNNDVVSAPGSYAAVLLEDVRRLLDSALSDEAVTALWRTASRRLHVDVAFDADEGFDADARAWLERVARACRERLAEVDPVHVPYLSPARTDLTDAVLREVREAARAEAAEVRGVARVLEDVVTTADPDLGFRLLLQILFTYDAPSPTTGAIATGPSANGSDSARTTWTTNCRAGRTDSGPIRRPAGQRIGAVR
jgi:hypothetical protein